PVPESGGFFYACAGGYTSPSALNIFHVVIWGGVGGGATPAWGAAEDMPPEAAGLERGGLAPPSLW
ncbi:MAG: hypothetical protein LBD18_04095, partial [Treponema sp.]|nr:hypothetical protein [Treponema sp.]